jgi:hypothetical protein
MTQNQVSQVDHGRDIYNSINIVDNGEMANLKRYVEETTKPGMVSYALLLTLGRPIAYYVAKGPITNCDRQLTPMTHPISPPGNGVYDSSVVDSPNDEGTFGGNIGACRFFYTEDGQLIRWTGEMLISDKPIRIQEQPLVIIEKTSK